MISVKMSTFCVSIYRQKRATECKSKERSLRKEIKSTDRSHKFKGGVHFKVMHSHHDMQRCPQIRGSFFFFLIKDVLYEEEEG